MCTASWLIHPAGFELFFNRDESQSRARAEPPATLDLDGVRVLAPRDVVGGGTWLGVNEFGLAIGLLNAGDIGVASATAQSRGLLVRALLAAHGASAALGRLEHTSLERFRGFTLALFEPGVAPRVRSWDGRTLMEVEARAPLCSSSLDGGRAREERARVFAHLCARETPLPAEALTRFQASHRPERGPWSPCMHRADAETVSASQIHVDEGRVALRYADGAPCSNPFGAWLELARRPA